VLHFKIGSNNQELGFSIHIVIKKWTKIVKMPCNFILS
jgi:hypothetical protein